jgi:ankyrin repeat protein
LAVVAGFDSKIMTKVCHFVHENYGLNGINCRNYLQQTPLHIASCIGNESVLRILLDFGADISFVDRNIENAIHLAVKYGNKNCLEILLSKCINDNKILDALNIDGFSALHLVIESESEEECAQEMIRLLVESGANISKFSANIFYSDKSFIQLDIRDGLSGRTPLIHSLLNRKQSNAIKNLLISLKADIYLTDYSGFKPINVMEENDI